MVTGSKNKLSYQWRLFLLLLLFAGVLIGCFVAFQYGRERRYKSDGLDARLQLLNIRLLDALGEGVTPQRFYERHRSDFDGLRLTVIARSGEVLYDSEERSGARYMPNHSKRSEVAGALAHGTGYTIRRHSGSVPREYFYSAMAGDSLIVRTALPYSWSLREVLAVDRHFIWFVLLVTCMMCLLGWLVTRRLGQNISRLRNFAGILDSGGDVSGVEPFPDDELGEISNHIVTLYSRLQRASADLEREHTIAIHEEQEKIRIKKQLTNNINHELKTPVSSIRGYLETILTNPDMEERVRRSFIEKSYAQTERLQRLLQDIAAVTRLDEASHLIEREEVTLNAIVEDIASDLAFRGEGSRFALRCNFDGPLTLRGNATLLHSIFRNLTDNALAYSGGSEIVVDLLSSDANGYLIRFANNGVGVEEKHLEHLFERFYRIDKGRSRKMGGTGLGLSIVKNAVLFHGGAIEARNREGGGLEFLFSLRKDS